MAEKRKYDSTIARMAGNIASGWLGEIRTANDTDCNQVARFAVKLARAIVAEVERTEPVSPASPEAKE